MNTQPDNAEGELNSMLERMINAPLKEHMGRSGQELHSLLDEELSYQKGLLTKLRQEVIESRSDLDDRNEEIVRSLRVARSDRQALGDQLRGLHETLASAQRQVEHRLQTLGDTQAAQTDLSLRLESSLQKHLLENALLQQKTIAVTLEHLTGLEARLHQQLKTTADESIVVGSGLRILLKWRIGLAAVGMFNIGLSAGILAWLAFGQL